MPFSARHGRSTRGAALLAAVFVLASCKTSLSASAVPQQQVQPSIPQTQPAEPPVAQQETLPAPAPAPAPANTVAPAPAPTTAEEPAAAEAPIPAPTALPPTAGTAEGVAAGYPFGPQSVWRLRADSAPVAHDSDGMVSHLAGTVFDRYQGIAAFNVYQYNNSYYVAPPGTPRADVSFHDCQGKGHVPDGLYGPGGQFTQVPIPAGAVPSPGTDSALSVYSPETDQLWEFWVATPKGDGTWSACWGGRIDNASASPGFFAGNFGATATGLSSTGGMIRLADVRSGSIEHAMSLAIPNPRVWSDLSWPAQRSDGFDHHPNAVPEGTRLRLDPSIDVASLGLHPLAQMIAEAAQEYGFIVVDKAGAVAAIAESGAPEEAATGQDPWEAILGGTPDYEVMEDFPWEDLQALPRDYGRTT